MKTKIILSVFALTAFCNCSGYKDYEKLIVDWAETNVYPGVRTDLKIKFIESSISEIHVSDSIAILKKKFQEEHSKKVEDAKKLVELNQKAVDEQKAKKANGDNIVAPVLVKSFTKNLEQSKEELSEAEIWHPDYLDKYNGRNPDEMIAKKAVCKFSYQEPKLTTRQERTGIFVLTSDGKRVIKMVKE
jgi:methyl coenzyme M reductase subunit C-like uncharacterized protein (methanogenesis marker protein 7)